MTTSSMVHVEGAAWSVSSKVEDAIKDLKTSGDIVRTLNLDYPVIDRQMYVNDNDQYLEVPNYHAIYREDKDQFLGTVKSDNPVMIQNIDSFSAIEPLLESGILQPVVADTYKNGSQIFCCFKFNDQFKILGDSFNQYFIVVNDHLKPNGKLQVINTPVRMACMNAFSSALSRAYLKFSIPGIVSDSSAEVISKSIIQAFENTQTKLTAAVDKMATTKISRVGVDKLLDELFPYPEDSDSTDHSRAIQTVDAQRETFVACLNADNIADYKGTMYGIWNALTDFTQHFFKDGSRGFDLQHRMTLLPGMNPEATTETLKVSKFYNNMQKFAASSQKAA